jgi:hypothetical protein
LGDIKRFDFSVGTNEMHCSFKISGRTIYDDFMKLRDMLEKKLGYED